MGAGNVAIALPIARKKCGRHYLVARFSPAAEQSPARPGSPPGNPRPQHMSAIATKASDSWVYRISAGLSGDLRYAARRLWKEKGFASLALLTLALCIGANTAIFSMVYALLLKPLPFPEPSRIVEIYNAFPKDGFDHFPTNIVQYSDFKANAPSFESIGLFGENMNMVGEPGSAERIHGADCTAEMFDILGLKPVIGQFFTLKNSRVGEDKVVVLAESFWKSHYNEDPA